MLNKKPIIGVMGSGKTGWDNLAAPLGAAIATLDVHLLTGGGAGVMNSVSHGFTNNTNRRGLTIGCIPTIKQDDGTFIARDEYPNQFVEIPIYTPLGTDKDVGAENINRNYVNIMTANVVIALPGSNGTRNEIDLAIRFKKPICLLGPHELPSDPYDQLPHFNTVPDAIEWVNTQLNTKG